MISWTLWCLAIRSPPNSSNTSPFCNPALAAGPCFALTARAFDEERRAAYAAGFDLVIPKPFSRRSILEAVRRQFPELEEPPTASRVPA